MTFHLFKGGVKQLLAKVKENKELTHRAHQILVIAVLLGMIPMTASADEQAQPKLLDYSVDQTTIVFDQTNIDPVTIPNIQMVDIKIGESHAEQAAREAAVAQTTHHSSKIVSHSVSVDPGQSAKRILAQEAANAYGVPWQIVEAVWQVESGKSWDTTTHSLAGAQGPAQFLPSTWKRYGVDADGDGVANIHDAQDAIHGEARYLAANGADRGQVRKALYAYNHADWYVNKVLHVADSLGYDNG